MDVTYAVVAAAAFGIQWGYQTLADGLTEYTIQLRAEEARHLAASGEPILSYVPAEAQPVGRVRIVIGEGPLPRGEHLTETQLRTTRTDEADSDVAGRLVAVPPGSASGGADPSGEGLKLMTPDGSPVGEGSSAQSGSADGRGGGLPDVSAPGLPLPQEGVTQPLHVVEDAREDKRGVRPLEQDDADVRQSPAAGTSPSDSLAAGEPPIEVDRSVQSDEAEDRPWLPLVAAAAVACGFLAGNVLQWRTYVSLRKRYLQLLRRTGG